MLIELELQYLNWIHHEGRDNPFHRALYAMSSRKFSHDFSIWVFALAILCIRYLGYYMCWNLIFGYFLIRIVKFFIIGTRPVQVDGMLVPRLSTRGSAAVSSLAVFSIIVFFSLSLITDSRIADVFYFLGVILFSYSRIATFVHFPHQILFSWILGMLVLTLCSKWNNDFFIPRLSSKQKLISTLVCFVLIAIDLLIAIDSCTSEIRELNMEKRDFNRVLNHIMKSDATVEESMQSVPKRDSFVKLIRSMERRSMNIPPTTPKSDHNFDSFRRKIL